jgi:non-specific serine/threonine protein kinase/serine/threonine-protein kinase
MNDEIKTASTTSETVRSLGDSATPRTIGFYRLLQKLGEGGMGEVWLAEQTHPIHRHVAVKVIKAGMDTAHVIARFETERQALAVMDHPGIAKVFDAGATPEGRPYFVMEYVRGEPLTAYCNRQRLSTRKRLDLFLQICDGVQHAHQKGIIHRDLKPSNILVTLLDSQPAPKIIDFGLAKAMAQPLTDHTLYTEIGMLLGTPEYMSPEQAEMTALDIDTRTDVYALGVILYELLTGSLPFDSKELRQKGLDEIRRTIREVEPLRPSARVAQPDLKPQEKPAAAVRELRGDLDWITMRALEKDRTRRYGSAAEFATDIRQHLNHLPVLAGPPGTVYRLGKFMRRHRIAVIAAATFILLLVAFATTAAVQARRVARERDRANQQAEIARAINDFLQSDLLAQASSTSQARPDTKPDPDLKVRTALDRAASRIEGSFKNQPAIEAAVRHTIGRTYYDLGLYVEAQPQLERSLSLAQQSLGPQNSTTLATAGDLILSYIRQAKYAQAAPLAEKTVADLRSARGDDDPQTLEAIDILAGLYADEGDYPRAEELYVKALDGQTRVLGEQQTNTLTTMNNLALLYAKEGKYAKAEPLFRKALEITRRLSGEEAPDTLVLENNLADLYHRLGAYPEAERLFSELIATKRRVEGEEHPSTLTAMNNLGTVYRDEGKYADAEPLFIKALEVQGRVLGKEHPNTLRTMSNLGLLYSKEGKYKDAERLLSMALDGRRRVLGKEHPDTLLTMSRLGLLYSGERKYASAEPLLVNAAESRVRALGRNHPDTVKSVNDVEKMYHDWGKPDKAAAWQEKMKSETNSPR